MKTKIINLSFILILLTACLYNLQAQWISASNDMSGLTVNTLAVNGNYIFAGTNSYGVYFSTDNCASWTQTSLNNRSIKSLAVSGGIIYAGATDSGLYKSTDNGTSWAKTSLGNHRVLAVAANGNYVYAGVGETPATSGVYISSDYGSNWLTFTLSGNYVISLTVAGNDIYAGTYSMSGGPLFKSQDNGVSWNPILNFHNVYSLALNNNEMFASSQSAGPGIDKSTDYGLTWSHKITISSLAVLINGGTVFSGGFDGAYISINDGENWTQQNDGFTGSVVINDMEIINNNIYAAVGNGVWKYDNTLTTLFADNAESGLVNWTTGNGGWSTENKQGYYHSASNSFTDSKKVNYKNNSDNSLTLKNTLNTAGYSNLVLSFWQAYNTETGKDFCRVEVSGNGGLTWQEVQNFSGQNTNMTRVGIDITSFAGNSNNVKIRFRLTSDKTTTADGWYIDDIKITGKTSGANFSVKSQDITQNKLNNSPGKYALVQNYPNSFNPSTIIRYSVGIPSGQLSVSSFISLKVYDASGKEVAILVNEHLNPGTYNVEWNASVFPSGVYFYQLNVSGKIIDTKKMILVK